MPAGAHSRYKCTYMQELFDFSNFFMRLCVYGPLVNVKFAFSICNHVKKRASLSVHKLALGSYIFLW